MDLQDLDYLSSAGVRVIIKTRNALKKNGGKLVFMNIPPQIKKVFDIINALPAMQIFMSVEELDDYLDVMQTRAKSQN
jgi:anti-anti-sigma factor